MKFESLTPLSVAVLTIMLSLSFLLHSAYGTDDINVYRGKTAEGGIVAERVRSTSGNNYEVLNITVVFTNGSKIYATQSFDQSNAILLCSTGHPIASFPYMIFFSSATNCFSIDPQSGLATNFTWNLHYEFAGGKPPGILPGMDTTVFTTDGITFPVIAQEMTPSSFRVDEYSYRFNGTSLVKNNSDVVSLNATQVQVQNSIREAFTNSWSAVSFLSSGVLEHGPRGLYVTDGEGGSANLTDAAGVRFDPNPAPHKNSLAQIQVHPFVVAVVLLLTSAAAAAL